jgi:transposase
MRRGRILAAEGDQDYAVDKARVRFEPIREVVESNEVEASSIGIWLARELQRLGLPVIVVDPSLLAGGAAVLDGAALAGVGPVATQDQSVFLGRERVGEP